mgnify:CR=1 FL=1
MIANPKAGWCNFKLGKFVGYPSYLHDTPIDLLDAFINYYENGYGVVCVDEEGTEFTFVLTHYNIFIIHEKRRTILYEFPHMRVDDLAKELLNDIESNLDGWCYEFLAYDFREKRTQYYKNELIVKMNKLKEYLKL